MLEPYDVAIVGLGPVGAALAARLGERVVVLERSQAPHALPRAAHLDDDALRVLQAVGVLDAVLAHGRAIDGFDLVDERRRPLLRARKRVAWPTSLPPALLVHQPTVEAALRARLDALPGADVRLGHTVETVDPDNDGVTIGGVASGAPFAVRARYAVGCDGARSTVREAIGSALTGGRGDERWLVVDALVGDTAGLPTRLLQIADARQPSTYVPFPGRRRRWEFRLGPGAPDDVTAPDRVRARLAPWLDVDTVEIERAVVYTFHDLVAERWRRGRLLLAGDAAHQMPPFLGQGLGAGLRDTATLAWMLRLVARGEAGPALLDAYSAERRPHVEATTRLAVRLGRLITASGPAARLRNAVLRLGHRAGLGPRLLGVEAGLPSVRPALGGTGRRGAEARVPQPLVGVGAEAVRLDDVLGRGFACVGVGLDAERWAGTDPVWGRLETAFVTLGSGVWDPSGTLAAWSGASPCAVVVRPDRIAFGVYGPGTGEAAAADLRRALSLR